MLVRYYFRRLALTGCLIAYPTLALLGPYQGHAEFYPFFQWNLFSRSNEKVGDAVILVKEIDGVALPRPTLFYELGGHFAAARNRDVRLAKMLDNLVRAQIAGDDNMTAHLTRVVENTFMADATRVTYDVAIVRYNPIHRHHTGALDSIEVIRSGEVTR